MEKDTKSVMNSCETETSLDNHQQKLTTLYHTAFSSPVSCNHYPRTSQRYRLTPEESFDEDEYDDDEQQDNKISFNLQKRIKTKTCGNKTATRRNSDVIPVPRLNTTFTPPSKRSRHQSFSDIESTQRKIPHEISCNSSTSSHSASPSLDAEFDGLFETVSRFFSPEIPLSNVYQKPDPTTPNESSDHSLTESNNCRHFNRLMQSKEEDEEDNNDLFDNSSFEDSPREINSATSIEQGNRHIQQISHAFDNLVQERDWLAGEIGAVHRKQDDVEAEIKQVENTMKELREKQQMLKKKQQEFSSRDSYLKSKLFKVDNTLNHLSDKIQNFENTVLSDLSESDLLSSHQEYRYEFSRQSLFGHKGAVRCVSVDDETGLVASGSTDTTVCLWDVESGEHRHTFKGHKGWIHALTCSDGVIISGSGDRTIKMWNAKTFEQEQTLKGHSAGISCIYADQTSIISGSLNGDMRQWDKYSGECVNEFSNPRYVLCLAGDQSFFLASGGYNGVNLWDLRSGNCTHNLSSLRDVQCISMDEDLIYTGELSGRVTIFDRRMWRPCHSLEVGSRITALGVYDNMMMVAADRKPLTFYDTHAWNATRRLKGSEVNITDFSCSLRLSTLISGSSDGIVKLWDL